MDNDVLQHLSNLRDATGAVRLTTYSVHLGNRELIVVVRDAGAGSARFQVEAYFADLSPDERDQGSDGYSFGNADWSLQGALENVHWDRLEKVAREG